MDLATGVQRNWRLENNLDCCPVFHSAVPLPPDLQSGGEEEGDLKSPVQGQADCKSAWTEEGRWGQLG